MKLKYFLLIFPIFFMSCAVNFSTQKESQENALDQERQAEFKILKFEFYKAKEVGLAPKKRIYNDKIIANKDDYIWYEVYLQKISKEVKEDVKWEEKWYHEGNLIHTQKRIFSYVSGNVFRFSAGIDSLWETPGIYTLEIYSGGLLLAKKDFSVKRYH